jgi:CoA:oxalate CoA-transferase
MTQKYPLESIRVLDFSRVVAGPFAGRLLADLGADVVKIEPPEGDGTRAHGHKVHGISGFFNQQNAGKRNISLNLREKRAVALALELVAVADIVIENYRPGVMKRLGIDYAVLTKVNPKLIMLSISGFGQSGPESHRPSYAPVVHAELGLMHRMAERNDTAPGDLPLSVADTNASLHGVIGILAALHLRAQTGHGQHIDMSMMDATFATDDRSHFELEGEPDSLPVCPILDLPFGRVFIAADPEMKLVFQKLVKRNLIEDSSNPDDDIDTKVEARRKTIDQIFQACTTLPQFSSLMDSLDIPWGEVRDPRNLATQATLANRNMLIQIDDRAGGTRPMADSPYRFSHAKSGVRGPAAHLGEHNREVLKDWLQLSEENVNNLTDAEFMISKSTKPQAAT